MATPSEDVRIDDRERVYDGFVKLDRMTLTHRTRAGALLTVVREVHDHGSGVAVLPVDAERRTVLLVRQFRVPVYLDDGDGHLVEACAGLIDADDPDPETTAQREAVEELGFAVRDLRRVGTFYSSAGVVTERMTVFLAAYDPGDRCYGGGGLAHEGEDIEVVEWSCDRLRDALLAGAIGDAKLMIAAQALMLHRPELFSPVAEPAIGS